MVVCLQLPQLECKHTLQKRARSDLICMEQVLHIVLSVYQKKKKTALNRECTQKLEAGKRLESIKAYLNVKRPEVR